MTGTNPDNLVMKPLYSKEQIHARVVQLGAQISKDLKQEPVLIITI